MIPAWRVHPDEWKPLLKDRGLRAFRGDQIVQALYRDYIWDWDQATTLPKDFRETLKAEFPLVPPTVLERAKAEEKKKSHEKAAHQEKPKTEAPKPDQKAAHEAAEAGRIQSMSDAKRQESIDRAEAEIAMAEAELKGLEYEMNQPETQADPAKSEAVAAAYAAKEKEIEERYAKWERLTEA